MNRTDFAIYLNKYLTDYMVNDRGSSNRTIDSYRYAFIDLLEYYSEEKNIAADKVALSDLTYDNISEFLGWLQDHLNNSISTRNQKQAAINSFIRYLTYSKPEYMPEYQRILGIPIKKVPQKEISYLKEDGIKLLMEQVSLNHINGFRDYIILMMLYTTGMRVSELINLKVKDISLASPYTVLVHGKGQKSRFIPLNSVLIPIIKQYIKEMHYDIPSHMDDWLFINHMKTQFTRQGICYIVTKYANAARKIKPDLIPGDISPHKLRHSTAMGLVASGVDLIYIRDLLGHVSVRTTERYARADAKLKREAIEAASKEIVPKEEPQWDNNVSLKNWLKDLCKSNI